MSLLDELFSGDDARAGAVVGQVGEAELPSLLAAIDGPDADARWWAVFALAHLPGDAATRALVRASADPDEGVRAAALHALGRSASPLALTPLLFALHSSEYLARLASDALIQLGALAVEPLIQVLEQDAQPRVRALAARSLAAIADTRAIPALFKALEDDSALVQHYADEGLERMGVGTVYFKP